MSERRIGLLKPGESDELPPRFMVVVSAQVYEARMYPDGTIAYVPVDKPHILQRQYTDKL